MTQTQAALRIAPLLKWPGGKTNELTRILDAAPAFGGRLIEPFAGGGAVWLATPSSTPACVNDASADLVAFYAAVQDRDAGFFALVDGIDAWWQSIARAVERHGGVVVALFNDRGLDGDALISPVTDAVAAMASVLRGTVPQTWADLAEDFVVRGATSVPAKVARMRQVERRKGAELPDADVWANIEGAVKAAAYTSLRAAHNDLRGVAASTPRSAALFFFLREYCYAAMFRFNASGEFNVPYGGISYNRKDFAGKIAHLRSDAVSARLATTMLANLDFADFLADVAPTADDWVFLDPPYDSDFSTYDGASFDRGDHERLAAWMRTTAAPCMLVIKSTPAVLEIYGDPGWTVQAFDKTYAWTIKQRNDRRATHLMITNR